MRKTWVRKSLADVNLQDKDITISRLPWLVQCAIAQPDRCAIRYQENTLCFSELLLRAERVAEKLSAVGVGEGDVLALALPNSLLYAEIFHACTLLGVIVVPLNIRLSSDELRYCLTDCAAKWCLCEGASLYEQLSEISVSTPGHLSVMTVDEFIQVDGSAHPLKSPHRKIDLSSTLCIMYTSGTTGRPKGVVLSYANFEASALATQQHFTLTENDSWLACMPLFHIGGLSILTRSAIIGFTVVLEPRFDPERVLLQMLQVSMVSFVPNMLQRVLSISDKAEGFSQLRAIILGGESLPEPLFHQALRKGFPVVASYGLTEACSQIAASVPGESLTRFSLFQGVEVKIVNHQGFLQAFGEAGEILIRGACVTTAYFKNLQVNKGLLVDGWLHSGDIGRLESNGSLTVLNRRADLIISGGENIYPSEVERVLLQHPALCDALVFGENDKEYGQRVIAAVVSKNKTVPDADDLKQYCRTQLAAFKVPARIEFVSHLQRSAAGKLIRNIDPS